MFGKIKSDKRSIVDTMVSFAEGRLEAKDFWDALVNQGIYDLLVNDKYRSEWQKKYNYPDYFFKQYSSSNLFDRAELHIIVTMYLKRRKITFKACNMDVDTTIFYSQIVPNWLDIRNDEFLFRLINSAPTNTSKKERVKYCKDKIQEFYKYEIIPPKWIQNPEWPIVNGKPLAFRKQVDDPQNSSRVLYYFYDIETKIETEIEQFD